MSLSVPTDLAEWVRRRAGAVCEYCLLPQASQEAAFHIDHIKPRVRGGDTSADNLALACVTCSLKKAARTHVRDPKTKKRVPFYHPRRDHWTTHFRWTRTWRVAGRTAKGRATANALGMNRAAIVVIRQGLAALGVFPLEIPDVID
jgi:hypothetical protein